MGCCGNKRGQWLAGNAMAATSTESITLEREPIKGLEPRLFQYLGSGSLTLVGMVSRRVYRFSAANPQLEVAAGDAPAMMGEMDLKAIVKMLSFPPDAQKNRPS